VLALLAAAVSAGALILVAPPVSNPPPAEATLPAGGIANIRAFLEQCPTNDPLYAQFRNDFEIRREGVVVGAIGCTEPVSAMPTMLYTDELIALQAVRTIYYMEGGRNLAYPWTSGSFYDWMKAEIGGIDIRGAGSSCCTSFNNRWYIAISAQSATDRDSAREWRGLSNRIALIGHETRHVDGYPHVGGCPLYPTQTFGCDQTYDESNLSPYGIQWWLNAQWLSGGLNVGYSCLESNEITTIATSHMNRANNDYGRRFVDNAPPTLSMPAQPGGPCAAGATTPPASPDPQATATPSPTPSPSPTASPTPTWTPPRIQGDVDCTGLVTSVDSLKEMRSSANLEVSQTEPCPEIGEGALLVWGDVDCSGVVNATDALRILRYLAGLWVPQDEPCADIGTQVPS
jgi:hypothetical protein